MVWGAACGAALSVACAPAKAQRADENVVTAAEDAFGTRVGNDNIGLYEARSARGFDPQLAGNIRIEGLFFDQQANLGNRLTRTTSMRIGLTAQSYPFPAPTGISDVSLVRPAAKTTFSTSAQILHPTGLSSVTAEISTPLVGDKLGMVISGNRYKNVSDVRSGNPALTAGLLFHWKATDNSEIIPFVFSNQNFEVAEVQTSILPAGAELPRRIDRSLYYGQYWATRPQVERNYGLIARTALGRNWRLQSGLFRSEIDRKRNHVIFFRNTTPDGMGNLDILRFPHHTSVSYSGEVRASGVYTEGRFRHTVHLAVRGRDTDRVFGGGQTVSFGRRVVDVYVPVPEPTYTLGQRDRDLVNQIQPGVSYVGQWANVGEFSVGIQKSFYERQFGKIGVLPTTTKARPWLYNGTLAFYPMPELAIYAGYTRGLEEFGTAPDNAANAGEPMPALQTKQIDAGVRYRIIPGLSLVAGVFEVSKPYFDRNPANVYTTVGNLRHRGVEMSLAGKAAENLTVIAGAVFLQARVSGLPVAQGLIGPVPPGTPPHIIKLNLQYDVAALRGFSVDTQLERTGTQWGNRVNTLRIPSANTVAAGVRYTFSERGARTTLRFQMQNLFNAYDWNVEGSSGRITPSTVRRFLARIAVDF